MRISVVFPTRFCRTPDGRVWTQGPNDSDFFKRYLQIFDEVNVISRVSDVGSLNGEWRRVDDKRISVFGTPMYVGPLQYLKVRKQVNKALFNAIAEDDAVILRSPDIQCVTVARNMRRKERPFGLEVIGDPYGSFAPGAITHPLRPIFRHLNTYQLKSLCQQAVAVTYVTESALQERYPPAVNAFATHYSSIRMGDDAYEDVPIRNYSKGFPLKLVFVGGFSQIYKGAHILIEALQICLEAGLDLSLTMIGGGKHEVDIKTLANDIGIADKVQFLGSLPGPVAVRSHLDKADIFVLPSFQEGLPRALIEAMARGLPSIATAVGGIPELLPEEDMVTPGNAEELSEKICEVVNNPERMVKMSARNIKVSCNYRDTVLTERRNQLYRYLMGETEKWMLNKK